MFSALLASRVTARGHLCSMLHVPLASASSAFGAVLDELSSTLGKDVCHLSLHMLACVTHITSISFVAVPTILMLIQVQSQQQAKTDTINSESAANPEPDTAPESKN